MTLRMCQQGKLQGWAGSSGILADLAPAMAVLETPFLFADLDAVVRGATISVLEQPIVAAQLRKQQLFPLAVGFVGWRAISSRDRPVRLPADVSGVRMRTAPVALHRTMWRLLGAREVPVELGDLAAAFRDRLVDATDQAITYVFAGSIHDQIRYHTRTNHMVTLGAVVINREAWQRLPPQLQRRMQEISVEAGPRFGRASEKLESELLGALSAAKVTVIELEPAQREAWRRVLAAPLERAALDFAGPGGAEILRAVRKSLAAR
jgi:TRAP-type C4-dicarboxylate transport system substrate-binding protein